jgi:hypothetical protein
VTEDEATELAERLNAKHPDRATHRWLARAGDGGWEVVKIGLPGARSAELRTEQHAAEGPPTAEDVRSSFDRNVGGPWVGPG